jgi:GDP-6-deoxy-D-talose 4-dehydrogenase
LLAKRLREHENEVVVLSRGASGADALDVDLCDSDLLASALWQTKPGVIVHLAGIATPTHGRIDEIYASNVVGTANLLATLAAQKLAPRLIVVASSAQVYAPNSANEPLAEESPLAPRNHYAVSKRAAEDIAALYSGHFPIIVTRPFNYTGAGQSETFLVPKIVRHYAERRNEIRVGNLDLVRDISDVQRAVEAYARLITREIDATTINICSGRGVYLADIFKIMEELSGHRLEIVRDQSLVRTDDPFTIVGSPSRLESLLGPLPDPDFRETLLRMYKAYQPAMASTS